MKRASRLAALLGLLPACALGQIEQQQVFGLLDLRYRSVDGIDSYLNGGYGKFAGSEGGGLSLYHAALGYRAEFGGGFGVSLVGNRYGDGGGDFGLTEAALHYRGLPSAEGLRLEARAGLLYPRVSLENLLSAWESPYTLDYSTQNAWIAEELRHQGVEARLTRLGKFHGSAHDFSLGLALLRGNDPTGAMLAWHGWVLGGRQSLQQEALALPNTGLGFVPEASEPFLELDGRTGLHATFEWEWQPRARLLAGWYDNNADPKVVNEDVQWAWTTRFAHLGLKWRLPADLELLAQYLAGDTLMVSPTSRRDLVYNDFHSAYLMLSRPFGPHRLSARVEEFAVIDRDRMAVDDNDEYGRAATLSYGYRLSRRWFLQAEYSWLRSRRPSRSEHGEPPALIERQWQLGLRCFF